MSEKAKELPVVGPGPEWIVECAGEVYGPFSRKDLLKLILSKQLHARALAKRADWTDFRSILDCLDLISKDPTDQKDAREVNERRMAAPRAPIKGIVSVNKENESVSCIGSNISTTGIFVKTGETIFRIGEKVDLIAQISGISKSFNAKAEIMRFSANLKFGVGYGLKFLEIDNMTVAEIAKVVGTRPIAEFGEIYSTPVLRAIPKK